MVGRRGRALPTALAVPGSAARPGTGQWTGTATEAMAAPRDRHAGDRGAADVPIAPDPPALGPPGGRDSRADHDAQSGYGPLDVARLIGFIEQDRIDLICFQEFSDRHDTRLDSYLAAQGWYRDQRHYVASRYPIVAEMPPLPDEYDVKAHCYAATVVRVRVRGPGGRRVRGRLGPHAHAPVRLLPVPRKRRRGAEAPCCLVGPPGHAAAGRAGRDARRSHPDRGRFQPPSRPCLDGCARVSVPLRLRGCRVGYGYTRPTRYPWFRIDHILASPEWVFTACRVGPELRFRPFAPVCRGRAPRPRSRVTANRVSDAREWRLQACPAVANLWNRIGCPEIPSSESITMSVTTPSLYHPSPDEINQLVHANYWNPFSLLGLHEVGTGDSRAWVVRAFLPEARQAWVVDLSEGSPGVRVPMERIHPDGFFEAVFPEPAGAFPVPPGGREPRGARLGVRRSLPVRPGPDRLRPPPAGRRDALPQLRTPGRPPPRRTRGSAGVHFAVWAPNAMRVSVVGNFNHWDGRRHPMRSWGRRGIWEIFIPDLVQGEVYKFEIKSRHNGYLVAEVRPLRLRRRAAAQDRLGRLGHHQVRLARRRLDGQPRRSTGPRRADLGLRGPPRLVEAQGRGRRTASSPTASWPTSWSRTSKDTQLHARRADADQRAPVRRELGLSAGRLLRADVAVRHARRLRLLRRHAAPARLSA